MSKKSNSVGLHTAAKTMKHLHSQTSRPQSGDTYPDKTLGSEAASAARKKANRLTDTERENLFQKGMRIIYGGNGTKEAVRTR